MKKLFLMLALFFNLVIHANFTLLGTTITQSRIDTPTSATTISGTITSTIIGVRIFDFGNTILKINGTINLTEGVAFHNISIRALFTGTVVRTYLFENIPLRIGQSIVQYRPSPTNVILDITNISSGID